MDFDRYCRHCGSKVSEIQAYDELFGYKCECTNIVLNRIDTISEFTRNARIAQLKAMHTLMCEANDENIYMRWIYLMPDQPSEEDFADIAINDEQYHDCFNLFIKLIAKNGNRY